MFGELTCRVSLLPRARALAPSYICIAVRQFISPAGIAETYYQLAIQVV